MQTAILKSDSQTDLKLLLGLAKKLGMETKVLTANEIEEIGLAHAIKTGRTGEFVNVESYLEKLRK